MSGWFESLYSYIAGGEQTPAATSTDGGPSGGAAPNVWPVSAQVAAELRKGVCYNMKVVLRGDRGTGKSTLLARLCGREPQVTYAPSRPGVSAATVRYLGRGCRPTEGTKVDLWEVVGDGGVTAAAAAPGGSAFPAGVDAGAARAAEAAAALAREGAGGIDVYRDCQLAIFLVHAGRRETWEYAQTEVRRVPPHTCVLFVLNTTAAAADSPAPCVKLSEMEQYCRKLPPMRTAFFSRALEGRTPSQTHSVPARALAADCLGAGGVAAVWAYLEVPNTVLRINVMETRLQYLYETLGAFTVGAPTAATRPSPAPSTDQGPNTGASRGDGGGTGAALKFTDTGVDSGPHGNAGKTSSVDPTRDNFYGSDSSSSSSSSYTASSSSSSTSTAPRRRLAPTHEFAPLSFPPRRAAAPSASDDGHASPPTLSSIPAALSAAPPITPHSLGDGTCASPSATPPAAPKPSANPAGAMEAAVPAVGGAETLTLENAAGPSAECSSQQQRQQPAARHRRIPEDTAARDAAKMVDDGVAAVADDFFTAASGDSQEGGSGAASAAEEDEDEDEEEESNSRSEEVANFPRRAMRGVGRNGLVPPPLASRRHAPSSRGVKAGVAVAPAAAAAAVDVEALLRTMQSTLEQVPTREADE